MAEHGLRALLRRHVTASGRRLDVLLAGTARGGQRQHRGVVAADVQRYDGMIRGFFDRGRVSPAAQAAIVEGCARFEELIRG